MTENWKAVPGHEGRYEVSDQGRVRSLDWVGSVRNKWGGTNVRFTQGRNLKANIDARGRSFITLWLDQRQIRYAVSFLVLLSFVGGRPSGLCVLHTDGNNQNNCLQNLRYGTHVENSADARKHGTLVLGEKHWNTKLTVNDVLLIRQSTSPGVSLAAMFGMTPAAISAIRTHKNWASV
jgi:hypothetical protein